MGKIGSAVYNILWCPKFRKLILGSQSKRVCRGTARDNSGDQRMQDIMPSHTLVVADLFTN